MHGAFKSLLQGDHLGVEFAASAHEGLLRGSGIIGDPPGGRFLNRCPVASAVSRWTGLIIDDLFAISAEKVGPGVSALSGPSSGEALLRKAKAVYEAAGVKGSDEKDEKDQFSARVFSVAGAQVDASPESASEGGVFVGLPASRRFALSCASLQVATECYLSEELASALAGCWVTALPLQTLPDVCYWAPLFLGKREASPAGSALRQLGPAARQDLVLLASCPGHCQQCCAPYQLYRWCL